MDTTLILKLESTETTPVMFISRHAVCSFSVVSEWAIYRVTLI